MGFRKWKIESNHLKVCDIIGLIKAGFTKKNDKLYFQLKSPDTKYYVVQNFCQRFPF